MTHSDDSTAADAAPPDRPAPDRPAPELLAPAGDWDCVAAAVENGADAIYFGLDCGFNARYRAVNFSLQCLPELMTHLRLRGVRGYVTMNTLAFPSELAKLADVITRVAQAGVDAILVQDFGVARLARAICPDLEIHASTQMSLTSAETIRVAADLGLSRVVVARELSIQEIRQITAATELPIEAFIHGALCVAYSGQCLTSESLGGRSANRGQCAQACRLPYELICDGVTRDTGDVRYLLSPQDLAGYAAIPDMIAAGIASLKIEGRLKTPEYVANITGHYRRAIDQAMAEGHVALPEHARREMELSFSRGFSPGWLRGNDHKRLVPGVHNAKIGIFLGQVRGVADGRLRITLEAPVARGDGLGIAVPGQDRFEGGRVYGISGGTAELKSAAAGDTVWIGFGEGEIAWDAVRPGMAVYKNDDPQLNKRLRRSFSGEDPLRTRPVDLHVSAIAGRPLVLTGRLPGGPGGAAIQVEVTSGDVLPVAHKRPADIEVLRDKLGRLGGTEFHLGDLQGQIEGGPLVPLPMLNQLRRDLVDRLRERLSVPPGRSIDAAAGAAMLRSIPGDHDRPESSHGRLIVLCRTLDQLQASIACGAEDLYADFHDIRQYRQAVAIARDAGVRLGLATIRMQKPGEMGLLKAIVKHAPAQLLVRNLAALRFALDAGIQAICDFSLNVTNHRSAQWLIGLGATRVTASYDLNRDQLGDLVGTLPAEWLEIVIHQHIPMFHMEHCVFCAMLSPGTNKTNCGRPCDRHVVQLRDRVGAEHTLQADIACRNTLYNATAQSGAEIVGDLVASGLRAFRIELLDQDAAQAGRTIDVYRRLLQGELSGGEVWRMLKANNQVGVTRGTLEPRRNPLAIL